MLINKNLKRILDCGLTTKYAKSKIIADLGREDKEIYVYVKCKIISSLQRY